MLMLASHGKDAFIRKYTFFLEIKLIWLHPEYDCLISYKRRHIFLSFFEFNKILLLSVLQHWTGVVYIS